MAAAGRPGAPAAACAAAAELLRLEAAAVVTAHGGEPQLLAAWPAADALGDVEAAEALLACGPSVVAPVDERPLLLAPLADDAVLAGAGSPARRFTCADLELAEAFALAAAELGAAGQNGAGPAVDPLALLERLAPLLARAGSEVEVGHAVVAELRSLIASHACRFYLLSPSGTVLMPVAYDGAGTLGDAGRAEDLAVAVGEGIAGSAVAAARSLLVEDAAAHPDAVQIPGTEHVDESMIASPLIAESGPIGVIVLTRLGVGRFGADDLRLLDVVAAQAAVACENARLVGQLRESAELAEALLEVGAVLAMQPSLDGIARMLVRSVDRLVQSAAISVWLRHAGGLGLEAQVGHTPRTVERLCEVRLDPALPAVGEALAERRLVVASPEELEPVAEIVGPLAPGSRFALVGIGEGDGSRGAIVVQRGPRRGSPDDRERQMLLGIADQALLAIVNRSLFEELEQSFLATMQALANALETKDEYTGEHAEALIGLSTALAERLGMTGKALRDVSFAAALHDIGKIGVPAEILQKPGPLSDEEWETMKLHPELGARIISPVPALAGAREIVLACHEHWDGSGYPGGLAGDRIPLGARVILACDAFHAMTSDRVYRAAMPLHEALAELRRGAGGHFDPAVVEALVELIVEAGAQASAAGRQGRDGPAPAGRGVEGRRLSPVR